MGDTWFIAFGVSLGGVGGLWAVAIALFAHHARRSRVARFAVGRGSAVTEGPVLLGGVVTIPDDEPRPQAGGAPVLQVTAGTARDVRADAVPFNLALPSGFAVRVEPEPGRWSLDTTFIAEQREEGTVYEAAVRPGEIVYVRGTLARERDPRAAGHGYRDIARAWVLRGDLSFHAAAVIEAHAARAAFHRSWAVTLGVAFTVVNVVLWSSPRLPIVGARAALLSALALAVLGAAYWTRAEATRQWVHRTVRALTAPRGNTRER